MEGKIVVDLDSGDKLIGFIVPAPKGYVNQFAGIFSSDAFDGIWLNRGTHVSYLSAETIVSKRPATIFDKEVLHT